MKSVKGKIIITTQPDNQAKRLIKPLSEAGFKAYSLPMIKINYTLPDAENIQIIKSLKNYNLLIFTSKNGVNGFFNLLYAIHKNYNIPEHLKIAVIGEPTAKEVKKYIPYIHYINEGFTSDDFVIYLTDKVIKPADNILLALGNLAPRKLQEHLNKIAKTERINVYNTNLPEAVDNEIFDLAKKQLADLTVFTSPSAFRNFIQTTGLNSESFKTSIACIGTTTGSFIKSKGYKVDLIAKNPDINSFAQEIITYLNNPN